MRFYEFNKSDTDLESALINVLLNMKGDADEKDRPTDISMDAVKQIMSNTGYPAFNYDVFKKIYDQDGDLKNVVADFDRGARTADGEVLHRCLEGVTLDH